MSTGRTIIVGGGVAGLSLAAAMADRGEGQGVVLLEREDELATHSSRKNASILRTAIDAPITRRLALRSGQLMRERYYLQTTGLILSTGEITPWLDDHLRADEVRELDAEGLEEQAPGFVPRGTRHWLFPRQGKINRPRMMRDLHRRALEGGVQTLTDQRVREAGAREVELEGGERLSADRVVIASGAFAGEFQDLGLQVTRRHIGITTTLPIDPNGPVIWDDVAGFYARPDAGGLLVCACDQDEVDAESLHEDEAVRDKIGSALGRALPDLAGAELWKFWAGLRPLTPDDVPLVGFDDEGRYWLTGLGGHGMTTALALAEFAASHLADDDVDDSLVKAMDPTRFLTQTSGS